MIFMFDAGAGTIRTTPPVRSTSQASSVAAASTSSGAGERALERRAAKDLRRLHGPQRRAVERAHDLAAVGLLDRVGHRRGGDRRLAAVLLQRGERVGEQLRA